jgi:D-alanine-D-alanine ligase
VRLGFTFNVRSATEANAPVRGLAGDAEEEFDPPETIQDIAAALRSLGHDVELLGDGEPLVRRLLDPSAPRPELVFNMAEGTGIGRSREARVPALLEMLGIPHTGSDPLTLAVALDKSLAKTIVAAAGVAVPKGVVVQGTGRAGDVSPPMTLDTLRLPLIAKPVFEGSSKGVLDKCLIDDREKLPGVVAELLAAYDQPVLVEEFIDGDELTVGVLGNSPPQVIGVMRIVSLMDKPHFVYSLEVKRDWVSRVRYECPAQISPADLAAIEQAPIWRPLSKRRCRPIRPSAAATWRGSISACAAECRTSSRPIRCRACRRNRATLSFSPATWESTTVSSCGASLRRRWSGAV